MIIDVFHRAAGRQAQHQLRPRPQFAGDDGKFIDLDDDDEMPWMAPSICMRGPDLDKLGLEADCELGDTIHLIGTVRLESLSNDGFSGERARLQIVELSFEDESSESREG